MDININELITSAIGARKNAYAPYSEFYVGAALLAASGKIFVGCNAENSSYPVGICAERSAFAAALSAGERKFSAIALIGGKNGERVEKFCYPCGMCRQFMSEFCKPDFKIISAKSEKEYDINTLGKLLTKGFDLDV